MFGLFGPRCPLGPRERVLVERGIAKLVDVIGLEQVRRTAIVTTADLQDVWSVEPVGAAAIVERLRPQFSFPLSDIEWQEEPDIEGKFAVQYLRGDEPVGIVPHQPDQTPEIRTAHVIRCLCQHALATHGQFDSAQKQITFDADLLAVLCGVGLFPANSTIQEKYSLTAGVDSWMHQRQPFMPSRLFGYALAMRSWLCDESHVEYASALRLDAKEPFDLGRKFLNKRKPCVWDDSRDTLRSFDTTPPVDDVVQRLRHREAAVQLNALYDVIDERITDASCLEEMTRLVHDGCDDLREELIIAIAILDVDHHELSEALTILGDDSSTGVRRLSAWALGHVEHPPGDAVETLSRLMKDAEPSVSGAAAEAMLRFPEGLTDERPRLFRVLRQQLARCDFDSVDRIVHRLSESATDAALLIEQEFSGAEDETWRSMLLQSLQPTE